MRLRRCPISWITARAGLRGRHEAEAGDGRARASRWRAARSPGATVVLVAILGLGGGFGPLAAAPAAAAALVEAPPRKGGGDAANKAALQKAQAEAQRKARAEAQRRAQAEAQRRARAEAQRRAQAEAQRRAQLEAQRRAQAEAQRRAQAEAQRRAQLEAQRRAQAEAQRRAQAEAQRRAQAEAQRRAQAEAQRRAQLDAQRRAQLDAQRRGQSDAQRRAQAEAQRRAQAEAQRRAQAEAQRRAQAEAQRRAQLDAQRRAQTEAQRRAQLDAQRRGQSDAQRRAQLDAQRRAQIEAQRRSQSEAQRRAQLDARRRQGDLDRAPADPELRRRFLDAARRQAELDARRRSPGDDDRRREDELFRRGSTAPGEASRRSLTDPRLDDRRTPATTQREALLSRRAELERRERERRQWILDEQARIARERAAARPSPEPRIRIGPTTGETPRRGADPSISGSADSTGRTAGTGIARLVPENRPVPRGEIGARGPSVPPLIAPTPTSFAAVRTPPAPPAPEVDPFIPVDPPSYVEPVTYVPPADPIFIDDVYGHHAGVHVYAPTINVISHHHWPSHFGYHSWVHPGHLSWAYPVHHGWEIGWSWNIAFGFGHDDWWFGLHGRRGCFPYVPYVAARRGWGHGSHYRWWHRGYHRGFGFGHHATYRSWYRPHIAWYHDVCQPRTTVVYRTVERVVAPPPPTLGEAWDAFDLGRIGRAADLFQLILDARPGDTEARIGLGLARARLGDIALAAADFRRALEADVVVLEFVPRGPGLTAELGLARTRLRDRLRVDPEDLDALLGLAVTLEVLGEPAAAYHAADRAIDLGEVSTAAFLLREHLDEQLLFGGG